jgi:phenylpyruvate tautomerase PptA (4-oxalocrotonate tautomerase family)
MPLVQVFTSAPAPEAPRQQALLGELSRLLAAAFVAVKNIGEMSGDDTAALSAALCELLRKSIDVPADRVYVHFEDAVDYLWGWNGATFA